MSDETNKTAPDSAPAPKAAAKPAAVKPAVKVEAVKPAPVKPAVAKVAKPVSAPAPKAKPVPAKPAVTKLAVKRPAGPVSSKTPLKPQLKKPAAPAIAAAAQKGTTAMTETVTKIANEAVERGQALFGDFNARAKAALEKSTKLVEELNEFNKGNLEAVVESTKVAAKGAEALGQQAADTARKNYEKATAAMKSFASVKSPTELFQLQSEYARSAFDSFVAESSKNTEAFLKLAGDVFQPLSNRIAVAAEKIKTVA